MTSKQVLAAIVAYFKQKNNPYILDEKRKEVNIIMSCKGLIEYYQMCFQVNDPCVVCYAILMQKPGDKAHEAKVFLKGFNFLFNCNLFQTNCSDNMIRFRMIRSC